MLPPYLFTVIIDLASRSRLPVSLQLRDIEEYFHRKSANSGRDRTYDKRLHHGLKSVVKQSSDFVDNQRSCMFYTCPESPASLRTYYCRYHSAALICHISKVPEPEPCSNLERDLRFSSGEISISEDCGVALQQLKDMYSNKEKNWIMDFEFVPMTFKHSPIPLQFAIRQIDGKLLYSGNVDYHLTMEELVEITSRYVSGKHGMMSTLFLKCYGGLKTNGETPSQIRDHILDICGYDDKEIQLLSWFSAHDMQCFLRILSGEDGLIQDKRSHLNSPNFQLINVGILCQKLFPGLTSARLQTVHQYLGKDAATIGKEDYHNAAYDTAVMANIIKVLLRLI